MSDSHSHVTEASGIQEEEDMRPAMTRSEQSVTEGGKRCQEELWHPELIEP